MDKGIRPVSCGGVGADGCGVCKRRKQRATRIAIDCLRQVLGPCWQKIFGGAFRKTALCGGRNVVATLIFSRVFSSGGAGEDEHLWRHGVKQLWREDEHLSEQNSLEAWRQQHKYRSYSQSLLENNTGITYSRLHVQYFFQI